MIALTRALVGDGGLKLRIGCCSLTEVVRKRTAGAEVLGAWDPVVLGAGDHLAQGASRDWGFEDAVIDENGEVSVQVSPIPHRYVDEPASIRLSRTRVYRVLSRKGTSLSVVKSMRGCRLYDFPIGGPVTILESEIYSPLSPNSVSPI